MAWQYRVFEQPVEDEDGVFTIREAYLDEDGTVGSWTAEHQHPEGSSVEELAEDLHGMVAALSLPVVRLSDDGEQIVSQT